MGRTTLIENISTDELIESIRLVVKQEVANLQLQKSIPRYYTRKEVSDLLKITLPTLFEYTRAGKIKGNRIGNRVLYSEDEVMRAVKDIATIKYIR